MMVVKTKIKADKINIGMSILLFFCVLLLSNCKYQEARVNSKEDIEKKSQSIKQDDSVIANDTFARFFSKNKFDIDSNTIYRKDSTINGSLFLMCGDCVARSFGDKFPSLTELPSESEGDGIILKSIDSKLYLKLLQLPGGGNNEFMSFEIGLTQVLSENEKKALIPTNVENFVTSSGIYIGMNKDRITRIKGKPDERRIENSLQILEYKIDNIGELFYNASLFFQDDKLIKYSFGYVNP